MKLSRGQRRVLRVTFVGVGGVGMHDPTDSVRVGRRSLRHEVEPSVGVGHALKHGRDRVAGVHAQVVAAVAVPIARGMRERLHIQFGGQRLPRGPSASCVLEDRVVDGFHVKHIDVVIRPVGR